MTPQRDPLFLERKLYRRRRLIDAVRLLPVLGLVLFLIPVLLVDREAGGSTAARLIYFFCAWGALIGFSFVATRLLERIEAEDSTAPAMDSRS